MICLRKVITRFDRLLRDLTILISIFLVPATLANLDRDFNICDNVFKEDSSYVVNLLPMRCRTKHEEGTVECQSKERAMKQSSSFHVTLMGQRKKATKDRAPKRHKILYRL